MGHQSNPDPMAKTNQPQFDPQWAKAKNVCRLNMDDIRMAKELGFSPQSLIKNLPSPRQAWKLSVKDWIRELHEKRFGRKTSGPSDHAVERSQSTPSPF
jgi:hypothetical protein